MNKENKILLGVLAFVVVCVVGYALFSETITINGTATATGDFDIGFECSVMQVNGNAKGDCSISGQTIITTSSLTMPTDAAIYTVTLTNKGSIPAVLKTVDSSNNSDGVDNVGDAVYYDTTYGLAALYSVYDKDGNLYDSGDSDVETAKLIIQPDES